MIEFEPLSIFAPETLFVTLILLIAAGAGAMFVSFLVSLIVFYPEPHHWIHKKLGDLKIAGHQLVVGHAVLTVLVVLITGGVFFGAFKMQESSLAAKGAITAVEEYYDADLQLNDGNNNSSGVFSGILAKDTGAPVIVTGRVEGNTVSVYADENASTVPLTVESFEVLVGE